MTAIEALKAGHKIRTKTWWWGKFIRCPGSKIFDEQGQIYSIHQIPGDWEIYDEEKHGIHNDR